MKIIVTGCKGQLGTELLKQLQEGRSELGPIPEKLLNATVIPVDLPELDISNYRMVDEFVRRNRPDIIINCAAPTNVDWCEVHHGRRRGRGRGAPRRGLKGKRPWPPQSGTGRRKDRRTAGARFHRLCVLRPGERRHPAG